MSAAGRADSEACAPEDFGAVALMGLLLVVPLIRGGNLPQVWQGVAVVVGLAGLIGAPLAGRMGREAGRWLAGIVLLALVFPIWGAIQMLPGLGVGAAFPVDLPREALPQSISLSPEDTGLAVLRWGGYLGTFILTAWVVSVPRLARLFPIVLFAGMVAHGVWALVSLYLLHDFAPWGTKTAYLGAATGGFVYRNALAAYLGLGLVLGVSQCPALIEARRWGALGLTGLGLFVCCAALFATQSRLGLGSASVAAVLTAVLAARRARSSVLIAGVLTGLTLAAALFGQELLDRGWSFAQDLEVRAGLYANGLRLIAARPLRGYGLDCFALAYEAGRSASTFDAFVFTDAHSTYLEFWLEAGLVFGSAPLAAGCIAAMRAIGRWRRSGGRDARATAALGGLALAGLHSAMDFPFEIAGNALCLGAIVASGCFGPSDLQTQRTRKG